MTAYQWGEFSDKYKKTEDKSKFYKEVAGEIVRRDAEKIKSGQDIRSKLGLMSASTLEKAKTFHWSNKDTPKHLSVVCADIAKANGSQRPEFDSMLMLERMCKLNPGLDVDNEKGMELDVKNGLMTLKLNGKVLIENKYVIEEAEVAAKAKKDAEEATARAAAERARIAAQTPAPAPVATPKPPEAVQAKPKEALAETAAWNKDIVLTFDDSLRNAPDIIRHLESNGIRNYRFYGEAATAMKPEVLADMGIVGNNKSTKLTPGKWLTEYIDKNRGTMSQEQYMREKMMKGADGKGTDYLKNGEELRKYFQEKYPSNWEKKIGETFAYHAAFLHPFPTDTKNHVQYWTPDQIQEDVKTYEVFIRAWLNIPNFQVTHLRAPEGGGFGYDKDCGRGWDTGTGNAQKMIDAVTAIRPGATWDNWRVSSHDTTEEMKYGTIAHEAIATVGKPGTRPYAPKENLLVLHANKYTADTMYKIDRLTKSIGDAYVEAHPETVNSFKVEVGASVSADSAWIRSAPEQGKDSQGKVIATLPKDTRVFIRGIVPGMPEWAQVTWGTEYPVGYMKLSQLKVDHREKPATIPKATEVAGMMEAIPTSQRHIYTEADRRFILSTITTKPLDKSKDQYVICVDRAKQYAAVVFFDHTTNKYNIVGNFGGGVSTGKQNITNDRNPENDRWATPVGVYDRLPWQEKSKAEGKPDWRTEGKGGGGFGTVGSRVFLLGYVDVDSPNGDKPLMVALHKTNAKNQAGLGKAPESHGCIRSTNALVDMLDNNYLLDGDYGRYVVVGDSTNSTFVGDNRQVAPSKLG